MRVLTVQQPRAYLAGALSGDAWLSTGSGRSPGGYLCLRVADEDFALAFAAAVAEGYGVHRAPAQDERGYWLFRTYNGHRRFDGLRTFVPTSPGECAAWTLGLFDSEGNVQLTPKPWNGPASWERRVAFYSTEPATLDTLVTTLDSLGLPSTRLVRRPTAGHLGSRTVEQVRIRSGRAYFERFAEVIGSNIARKQAVLDRLPTTYRSAA